MAAIELTSDRATKAPANLGGKLLKLFTERGLYIRVLGDIVMMSPPLIISEEEINWMLQVIGESLAEVVK